MYKLLVKERCLAAVETILQNIKLKQLPELTGMEKQFIDLDSNVSWRLAVCNLQLKDKMPENYLLQTVNCHLELQVRNIPKAPV